MYELRLSQHASQAEYGVNLPKGCGVSCKLTPQAIGQPQQDKHGHIKGQHTSQAEYGVNLPQAIGQPQQDKHGHIKGQHTSQAEYGLISTPKLWRQLLADATSNRAAAARQA